MKWRLAAGVCGLVALAATAFAVGPADSSILTAARFPALTGDVTTGEGSVGTTLATVNSNVGTFGSATGTGTFTVNGKGLITAASTTAIAGLDTGVLTTGTLPVARGGTGTTVGEECNFSAFVPAGIAITKKLSETVVTNAATLRAGSNLTNLVIGVGSGSYVVRLCSDGTTCGAGNIYLTCTQACTTAIGTTTACTLTKTAVAAGTTLTWEIGTACATTNQVVNLVAHYTVP